MYIGVLTVPFGDEPLDDAFDHLSGIGVDSAELAVDGWPDEDRVDRSAILADDDAQTDLLSSVESRDLQISALTTHNNPLHPVEETATETDTELREAIELADAPDVNTVICFSGLPVGGLNDEIPNWITAPWPTEHVGTHDYQWEVVVGYWSDLAAFADNHSVGIAIEMHPNMPVCEPTGMLKLREATNEHIGANFDPSHLYWQDISITDAIRFLGEEDATHHFHAKDTKVYESESRIKGALDTTSYADTADRSWLFRSIGYDHDEGHWKDTVSTLRMVGYEGTLSIEHEDVLTSSMEGLEKAVDVLSRAVFETQPGDAYWAE